MTLKEKLKSFAMDNHIKKYAEHNVKELEKIADEYAIEFAEFSSRYGFLEKKGFYKSTYNLEMGIFITSKELLEIFKKEKGL